MTEQSAECSPCDCVPSGTTRCYPQFGPLVALPLDSVAQGGTGVLVFEDINNRGNSRFSFDWSALLPGLTGIVNSQWGGNHPLARTRFGAIFAFEGLITGNTTRWYSMSIQFSRPVQLRRLGLVDFDGPNNEMIYNISPPFDALEGNFVTDPVGTPAAVQGSLGIEQGPGVGFVRSTGSNQSGALLWNSRLTSAISFGVAHNNELTTGFPNIEVQEPLPDRSAHRYVCDDGSITWRDTLTYAELTPAEVAQLRDCDEREL